jgi:hypothetical protein
LGKERRDTIFMHTVGSGQLVVRNQEEVMTAWGMAIPQKRISRVDKRVAGMTGTSLAVLRTLKPALVPFKASYNVALFERIKLNIRLEPERVDMRHWLSKWPEAVCSTVACIAGWASVYSLLADGKSDSQSIYLAASRISSRLVDATAVKNLGIDWTEAKRLFYVSGWPRAFGRRLDRYRPGTKGYARAVCDRIDHFVTTGE